MTVPWLLRLQRASYQTYLGALRLHGTGAPTPMTHEDCRRWNIDTLYEILLEVFRKSEAFLQGHNATSRLRRRVPSTTPLRKSLTQNSDFYFFCSVYVRYRYNATY